MNIFFSAQSKIQNAFFEHNHVKLNIQEFDFYLDFQIDKNKVCDHLIVLGDIILPDESSIEIRSAKNLAYYIYEQFISRGSNFLKSLDGKFTLIILQDNKFIIFRDRAGSGPIIYFDQKYFTTNLNLFKRVYNHLDINNSAIDSFLRFGYIQSPHTIYKNIHKLAGGQFMEISRDSNVKVNQLYTLDEYSSLEGNINISQEEAIEELIFLHKKALKKRIKKSNSIGVLLSGGFDSGGNLHNINDEFRNRSISGISIGFKNHELSELDSAKLMAKSYDIELLTYELDGSEIDYLDDIISEFGEPFFEGGLLLNFAAMKMASSDNFDVIIGGDGNDQTFGTGSVELAARYINNLSHTNYLLSLISRYDNSLINQKYNWLYKYLFYNRKINGIFHSDDFGFSEAERIRIIGDEYYMQNSTCSVGNTTNLKQLFLEKTYCREISQVANEIIVKKASIIANMFGCNIQFPYLDLEFYNFVSKLPWKFRLKGNLSELITGKAVAKYIFKKSLQSHLPPEIYSSKKQGGFTPLSIYIENEMYFSVISEQIKSSDILKDKEYIDSFLMHCQKEIKNPKNWFWYRQLLGLKLFNLLVLARWYDVVYLGMNENS